jgi:hypothetical protein
MVDDNQDVDMPDISSSPLILPTTADTSLGNAPLASPIIGSQPLPLTQIELQNIIASAIRDYLQQNGPAITVPNPATTAATPVVSTPRRHRNQRNSAIPATGSQSRGREPLAASPIFEAANAPPVTSPTRSDGSNLPDLSALFSSVRRSRSSFIHPDGILPLLIILICTEVSMGNRVFANRGNRATTRANSEPVDYSVLTPMEILQREQDRAVSNRQTGAILWTLHGDPTDHTYLLIEYIYNCLGPELKIVPVLRIPQSISIDAGGIFRDKINRVFDYLMQSDILVKDPTTRRLTFAEFDAPSFYREREKLYVVFGTIFYWFILMHRLIPYPLLDLNPAIVAYAIYGYIPQTAVDAFTPSAASTTRLIARYTVNTTESQIHEEVKSWLTAIRYSFDSFMTHLHDPNRGPAYLMREVGTQIVLGRCQNSFDMFREGFRKCGDVPSVLVSPHLLD